MAIEIAALIVGVGTLALEVFNKIRAHGTDRTRDIAIKKLYIAISATSDYLDSSDRLRRARDSNIEQRLDRLWQQAAHVILPIDARLAERLYIKEDYWRNPDRWTEQQLLDADIKLRDVRKRC